MRQIFKFVCFLFFVFCFLKSTICCAVKSEFACIVFASLQMMYDFFIAHRNDSFSKASLKLSQVSMWCVGFGPGAQQLATLYEKQQANAVR
jgi:hypothetical protein